MGKFNGWIRVDNIKDAISKSVDQPIAFGDEIYLKGKVVLQWSKPVEDAMNKLTE